ncbi:MAG: hypothetical protein M1504_01225 [Candidatus Marsarchaeota archaeon]|nr:hypothetical protein [Candidatus Marsarchaeota archaeon]
MYYSELSRIKRIERILERLAYLSVGLDVFVAVATLLVMRGATGSSTMLLISGYLMFIEVVIAVVLFSAMISMRHYKKLADSVALNTFINKYHNESVLWKTIAVLKRIITLDV